MVACLYKRGKTWSFTIDLGKDENGKRKKKGVGGFRTKKEAEEAAAKIKVELAKGIYIMEKDILFEQFTKEWLKRYAPTVKISTRMIREGSLKRINKLAPHLKTCKLAKIKKIQLEQVLLEAQKNYSQNTLKQIQATLSLIFNKALELELIHSNPMTFVNAPKKGKTFDEIQAEKLNYLERDQLEQFLHVAQTQGLRNDYTIFLMLSYLGLRVGELCALQWQDIDFAQKTIRINKTIFYQTNSVKNYLLWPPKTKKSNRIVDAPEKVIEQLKRHQKEQSLEQIIHHHCWHDQDFVFTSEKFPGYPLNHKRIETRMKRLLKICAFNEKLYPHSLRHTHTSLLAEAGVGLEEIMERLGHADGQITKNIYLHITKNMKREAMRKFERLMANQETVTKR